MIHIVFSGRNDFHGGSNFADRVMEILNWNVRVFAKYGVEHTFWFVEWGREEGRDWLSPRLAEKFDNCRCIMVPNEIVETSQEAPVHFQEFAAKNIGIAHSGEGLIIATNGDILFSDALAKYLKNLVPDDRCIYRAPRHDFVCSGPLPQNESELKLTEIFDLGPRYGEAAGDFTALTRAGWELIRGYSESKRHVLHLDSEAVMFATRLGLRPIAIPPVYHREHPDSTRFAETRQPHKGEYDKDLFENRKVMPRNQVWGHRDCVLVMQSKLLAFLKSDDRNKLQAREEDSNQTRESAAFKIKDNTPDEGKNDGTEVIEKAVKDSVCDENGIMMRESERESTDLVSTGPYLSIVVTSRNDDYDSNMLHRMQVFTNGLAAQCKRFNLDAELIIVEWNPPADKKRLYEVLKWPDDLRPLTVRFIEVPAEIHNSIGNSDKIPFFQMTAKNVGIRRAIGKFVLATNIDILFSDELMQFLAARQLDENCFYRVDRYDVGCKTIPTDIGIEEQLEFCRNNVVRVQTVDGTKSISEFELNPSDCSAAQTKLHTYACGDFTLMAYEKWYSLMGHPEVPLWSIYVDGLFLRMVYSSRLRQVILSDPMRIYHIEHDISWAHCTAAERERITEIYPSLDYRRDYLPWCHRMIEENRPITNNDRNWGYGAARFEEHIIGSGRKGQNSGTQTNVQDYNHRPFQQWIDTLALAQNRLYYRDQTPESLKTLVDMVHRHNPTKIVELGTLSGLSLRAWLAAKSEAEIIAVDLSFKALLKSQKILPADFSKVKFLEQDILKTNFSRLWSNSDRMMLYIDAHDTTNVLIMRHIIDNMIPILPSDSIIIIDDLWHSQQAVSKDSVCRFFEKIIVNEIDRLLCFEGYYAPYWKGGFFIGFREVIPLMEWINHNRIELIFRPGNKVVAFRQPKVFERADEGFDRGEFERMSGSVRYNPVEEFGVYPGEDAEKDRQASVLCERGTQFYGAGHIREAEAGFKKALDINPDIRGAYYARAICFARGGDFKAAQELLRLEISGRCPHSQAKILYEDINRFIEHRDRPVLEIRQAKGGNVTLFALPKAFCGNIAITQKNAIKSWMLLKPKPEIILFGNDEGVAEIAREFGIKHIPDVKRNGYSTPLVNDLFEKAQSAASNNILVYIDSDIILMSDFTPAVQRIASHFNEFLMIGRRWDLDVNEPLDFEDEKWEDHLRIRTSAAGTLHPDCGIDYFAFTKGFWAFIPDFGIGRCAWDNWFIAEPLEKGKIVVDTTDAVTVVHQNHESVINSANRKEEVAVNRKLAGRKVEMGFGTVSDTPWQLTESQLVLRKHQEYPKQLSDFYSRLIARRWESKIKLYQKCFHSVMYRRQVVTPDISIVVTSRKFCPDTVKSLQSLASQQDVNFELILVSNGADEDEFGALAPFIDTYVRLSWNAGVNSARNIGAVFAEAPVILFLDDDGIADENMLRAYIRAFEKYDVIAVHGAIRPADKNAPLYTDSCYYGPRPFPCISQQERNSAYNAAVFYRVGGWGDKIVQGGGGVDLSHRLINVEPDMRKQIYYPDAILYHDSVDDEKAIAEEKPRQKESEEQLKQKRPDCGIYEKYFSKYFQREELLINRGAADHINASANRSSEHIYPAKAVTNYIIRLKREAKDWLAKGVKHLGDGNMDEAMKCLSLASINQELPNLHFSIAAAYVQLGGLYAARRECEMELKLQPEHRGVKDLLKQIEKAIDEYERIKAGEPDTDPKEANLLPDIQNRQTELNPQRDGLTVFAMPKAFCGKTAVIQKNAVKSWTLLKPRPEVILLGNDEGVAEIAKEFGIKHIPDVRRNGYGTPLVNDIFEKARAVASNNILMYINSDIILMSDFMPAVQRVAAHFNEFLMMGQRWDVNIDEPLNFENEKWEDELRTHIAAAGSLHIDRGIDYFVFTKGFWPEMPSFGLGRTAWDNWLVGEPISRGKPVVDATEAVTIAHQNHECIINSAERKEEMTVNKELAGTKIVMGFGAVSDAPWQLTKTQLVRRTHQDYTEQFNDFCSRLIKRGWENKYRLYRERFHSVTYRRRVTAPDISVVVISWRFNPDTIKNFQSLESQRGTNFELIFVNNGAGDSEFDRLMPFIDTYVRLNTNTGAYLARNVGAVFAQAPIIIFLDDDGIADKNFTRAYIRAFEKYDAVVVRGATWPKDKNAGPYRDCHYYGPKPFPYLSHQEGNSAYKSAEFYKVGGWDDKIIRGGGGIDLSRRLIEVEPDMRKQIYFPEAVLYHDPVNDKGITRKKQNEQRESREYLRQKHPDYGIFEGYYGKYFRREDLLILKNAAGRTNTFTGRSSGHIYPSRAMVDYANQLKKRSKDFLIKGVKSFKNGNMEEAFKYFGFASVDRKLPNMHFVTAVAYVQLGRLYSAREECELELKLQPEHKDAKELLAIIEEGIDEYERNKATEEKCSRITGERRLRTEGKDDNPLVSVIMPAYNASGYIVKAIESVLIQNYGNFELVIVDDGSTDDTKNIIAGFKDAGIKYFYNEHKGPSAARNLAISRAGGQYIIPLDSDDMMVHDFIALHLQEFEKHPEADMVYCDDCLIDADDNPVRVIKRPEYADRKLLISDLFRKGFPVVPFRTCIKRDVFDRIGFYDESLLVGEDYDMVRRFVKNGLNAYHLCGALYLRRISADSLTRDYSVQKAQCHFEVIKRFAETFGPDELFPDVQWDKIPPEVRQLHAKCKAAATCLTIGQTYVKENIPDYANKAFELACSQVSSCLETDPENQQVRQLLEKCESVKNEYSQMVQQAAC